MISISEIKKQAKLHQVPVQWALQRRIVFLKEEMKALAEKITYYVEYEGRESDMAVALIFAREANEVFLRLAKEVRALALAMKEETIKQGTITDEMISQARAVPVNHLIDFRRGKAKAWCHDDNNPSLYHGTRLNLAVCPVCDKKFDAIQVLIDRDGKSFKDAVMELSQAR